MFEELFANDKISKYSVNISTTTFSKQTVSYIWLKNGDLGYG